jgi:GDP-L-fucose synthase
MKKKVLVLGSNGLVGNSVSSYLKDKKFEVIKSNREDTNLFSFQSTKELISNTAPHIIVNAAAKVGGIYANDTHRTEFLLSNLKINMNVLESCIPYKDIKIINLGSSCIYPLNAENPITENSFMEGKLEPTNSPYAMAKLTAIELGRSLSQQHGHKVINLMPTNLYGPNDNFDQKYSHVIPGLISRMFEAKNNNLSNFKIWGSGKPLREFLYVKDLSDCIAFIIENNIELDLINVGSGVEVSIKELAIKIQTIIGFEGSLSFDSSKPDGNPRKLLDSSLINDLGWKAETDLMTGLKSTIEWYRNN